MPSKNYEDLHNFHIPNDISPPFHFDPIVPGMKVDRTARPFRISDPPAVTRPSNLEDVAFWPVRPPGGTRPDPSGQFR